jgi:hypothetical protein
MLLIYFLVIYSIFIYVFPGSLNRAIFWTRGPTMANVPIFTYSHLDNELRAVTPYTIPAFTSFSLFLSAPKWKKKLRMALLAPSTPVPFPNCRSNIRTPDRNLTTPLHSVHISSHLFVTINSLPSHSVSNVHYGYMYFEFGWAAK